MLSYPFKYTSSYFTIRHSHPTKILSSVQPRPFNDPDPDLNSQTVKFIAGNLQALVNIEDFG
jgi:hypothetical protein